MKKKHVIIVGAGLAGLAAAREIEKRGGEVTLIEKNSFVGGRVATKKVQGFLLDRGFQVLQSSYTLVQEYVSRKELHLESFDSAAFYRAGEGFVLFAHPLRHPLLFLRAGWQSVKDSLKLLPALFCTCSEGTTRLYLKKLGISVDLVNQFFTPFLGGVFLERDLATRSSLFQRYIQGFFWGKAQLPREGMAQLPEEMRKRLHSTTLLLETEVTAVEEKRVTLSTEEKVEADAVILATDLPAKRKLCGEEKPASCAVTTLYYRLPKGAVSAKPCLYLSEKGPINNCCFPSLVQPSYAPKGQELLSVSVLEEGPDLEKRVRAQLKEWFGEGIENAELLEEFRISHALPLQVERRKESAPQGVGLAGEALFPASINDALRSGKEAAQRLRL